MELYSSSGTPLLKPPIIFKVKQSSGSTDFFRKENVEQSPWGDLKKIGTFAAFGTVSVMCWDFPEHCRSFEIMKTFGDDQSAISEKRCDKDFGWLTFTAPNNNICPFEKKSGRRSVFLYSKGKAAVRFNDDSELSKCLSNTFSFFFIPLDKNYTSEGLLYEKMKLGNRKLKQATFLSHGGKPEVNTSRARKVVFPRFSNCSSLLGKNTQQYKCGSVKTS